MNRIAMLIFVILGFFACTVPKEPEFLDDNPAAENFNMDASDPEAIALADSVMLAMGGRRAWDDTEFIQWNFFDVRRHLWNKKTGDLIIDGIQDSFLIRMNIEKMTGQVNLRNKTLVDQDSIQKYLQKGKEMWINDGYWIFLPFKLKDSGVTLHYLQKDTASNGQLTERISLSFDDVGVTPENKYIVYIDTTNYHIIQWDFYNKSTDSIARFSTPWLDYEWHEEILLSSSRGENYTISEIAVGDSLSHNFVGDTQKSLDYH